MENEIQSYFRQTKIKYCSECQHRMSKHEYTKRGKVYVCKICGCKVKKMAFV